MEKVFYFPCAKNSETTGNIVHLLKIGNVARKTKVKQASFTPLSY